MVCTYILHHRKGVLKKQRNYLFSTSDLTIIMATPRANGILSIPASATQKRPATVPPNSLPKAATPRLKIIIRRLPPGLSSTEFEETLGQEWRPNGGKVDWLLFKNGKPSKEYSI